MNKINNFFHDFKCSFQSRINNQSALEEAGNKDIRRAVHSLASSLNASIEQKGAAIFILKLKNDPIYYSLDFSKLDRAFSQYITINEKNNKPNGRTQSNLGKDGNLHIHFYDFHYLVKPSRTPEIISQGVFGNMEGIDANLHLQPREVQSLRESLLKNNSRQLRSQASLSRASSSLNQFRLSRQGSSGSVHPQRMSQLSVNSRFFERSSSFKSVNEIEL